MLFSAEAKKLGFQSQGRGPRVWNVSPGREQHGSLTTERVNSTNMLL